jgi:hypothetical protein
MAKWWWKDRSTFESLVFKRVPQGWIYRSSIQWGPFGIGRPSHFLLSDAQKDEISNILYRLNRYLAVALLIVFLAAFLLLWSFRSWVFSAPLATAAILVVGVLLVQYLLTLVHWLMLRTSLGGTQPTSERITVGERFNAIARAAPRGFLRFYAVFFTGLLAFFINGAFRVRNLDLWLLPSVVLAAGGIIVMLLLLRAKHRAQQN